jgi:hypothetical protein
MKAHSARLLVSGAILPKGRLSRLDAGDGLEAVTAIVDYSYGRYKLFVTDKPRVERARPPREVAQLQGDADHLTLASLNVHNLDATDTAHRFQKLAAQIVHYLRSPDVLSLNEVQDDNGAVDDGRSGARLTIDRLLDAIRAEGGPAYAHRQIDPRPNEDGGEPGGNIRRSTGPQGWRRGGGPAHPSRAGAERLTGAHRSATPGIPLQPQAAGHAAHVQWAHALRDRQSLRFQAGRSTRMGPLSAARVHHRAAAHRAGGRGGRLRARPAGR